MSEEKIGRRSYLKNVVSFAVGAVVAGGSVGAYYGSRPTGETKTVTAGGVAGTPDDAYLNALVAAAKKEGAVLSYDAMDPPTDEALKKAFNEKYPEIKVSNSSFTLPEMYSKVYSEFDAKINGCDVMITNQGPPSVDLARKGMVVPFSTGVEDQYPPATSDPQRFWHSHYAEAHPWMYNKDLVSAKDVPKTYEDVVDPKWKGKMAVAYLDSVVLGFGHVVCTLAAYKWGQQKTEDWIRRFMALDPREQSGAKAAFDRVNSGEAAIGLGVAHSPLTNAPGNVVSVYADPTIVADQRFQINALAPHPNAAKLYARWMFSDQGQLTLSKTGRSTVKLGLPDAPYSLDKLIPKGIEVIWGNYVNPDMVNNPDKWQNWLKQLTGKK